jgi:hypothetical protein
LAWRQKPHGSVVYTITPFSSAIPVRV